MRPPFTKIAVVFFLFALFLSPAFNARRGALVAWGKNGHRVTIRLAERGLSRRTKRAARALLGGESLSEASLWPDKIRIFSRWRCSRPFHYLNAPDRQDRYAVAKIARGKLLPALVALEEMLRVGRYSARVRRDALRFYIHLMGDLHQPLHAGRSCDRGGNSVRVRFFGKRTNLHRVWDKNLFAERRLSFSEAASLLRVPRGRGRSRIIRGSVADWAYESYRLRKYAYRCYAEDRCKAATGKRFATFGSCDRERRASRDKRDEPRLGYMYLYRADAILDQRFIRGGTRLAARLNAIFQGRPPGAKTRALIRRWNRESPNWRREIQACLLGKRDAD